jgi:hypothetical protein
MKLKGWHRLWIFVSLVYLCLIIIYCFIEFPKPERIAHKDEFYKELSKQSFSMLYYDPLGIMNDNIKVEMPNSHVILFSNKFKKEEIESASKEYWTIIENKANKERLHLMGYAFLFWLIPCTGVYLLGWGIRWVYQGFKSK